MASDALSLTNVHAFYGDSHILHGVSFSLAPGAVLALLGRNGAGKTTCISTIIGLLAPREGEIRLYGDPIAGLSAGTHLASRNRPGAARPPRLSLAHCT